MAFYEPRGPTAHRFRVLTGPWWAGDSAVLWLFVVLFSSALLFWWIWGWADQKTNTARNVRDVPGCAHLRSAFAHLSFRWFARRRAFRCRRLFQQQFAQTRLLRIGQHRLHLGPLV